jgi:hypothetical protein
MAWYNDDNTQFFRSPRLGQLEGGTMMPKGPLPPDNAVMLCIDDHQTGLMLGWFGTVMVPLYANTEAVCDTDGLQ